MQALVLKGRDVALEDRPVPEPKRGEVRVRVTACGANASDWEFASGRPFYGRLARLAMRVDVIGSDVVGIVDKVGEGVDLTPGTRVVADTFERFGGFAPYCVDKAARWVPLPEGIDDVTAAALPQSAAIALTALADVPAGARVLVNGGGGGSGPLAIQLAVARGAVVTACDTAAKAGVMTRAGASRVVDYRAEDAFELGPFDRILDLYGTRAPARIRRALAPGGTYRLAGGPTGKLIRAALARGGVGVLMVKQGPEAVAEALSLVSGGTWTPVIGDTVPLSDAPEALRRMGRGEMAGKLVIRLD